MKTIIKISQKTFGAFKLHAMTQAPNDYYSKPHANAYRLYQQDDFKDVQAFECFMTFARKVENFPFNFYTDPSHPQHFNQYVGVWCGYYIDHTKQLYAYRTCGGNAWGVYKDLSKNEYFAFYDGARSRVQDLVWFLSADELNSKPVFLESHAPKDMNWHETQADYLIRKGETHTARYLAQTIGGIPQDRLECGENICDAYGYFAYRNPNFDDLIFAELFKNQSPEQYILAKFRNKKVKPDSLSGKDLTAWNLLGQATQERILRWQ